MKVETLQTFEGFHRTWARGEVTNSAGGLAKASPERHGEEIMRYKVKEII